MNHNSIKTYNEYINYLKKHPDESKQLLDTLTVNVTELFRNPDVYNIIEKKVIPDIFSKAKEHSRKNIRIWSAGCSSGEEPYSIAMIFLDILEKQVQKYGIIIYATDIDKKSLEKAKAGIYSFEEIKNVGHARISKYFDHVGDKYHIKNEVKKLVSFKKLDMISEPGLNAMDMILCRNVVIYFSNELKERLYVNFYNSLRHGGYFIQGKTEMLKGDAKDLFEVVNNSARMYKKP